MAVIQISKIQVRRGRKNSDIGVPQLSSAEFAWAVDTQELFIGNGSITEGAPYVGNTKVLTEHDNILELVSGYTYGLGNTTITQSVSRSLQSKIDEIEVSVVDFGADPSGESDSREAFENACLELFKNVDPRFKRVLKVPNGNYVFADDLHIPSGAFIRGDNPAQTFLSIGDNSIYYVSENGTEKGLFSSSDRPHDIVIENITVVHESGQVDITGAADCTFTNVRWKSNYELSNASVFVPENAHAIYTIPNIISGGNVTVSGSGVSAPIVTLYSSTFSETLNTAVISLNADSVFSLNFVASLEANGIKINSLSNTATATDVASEFTVSSLSSNEGIDTIITPVLAEYDDGSGSVSGSVHWGNDEFGTRVNNITFDRCHFTSTPLGVECTQTVAFETEVFFKNCTFFECDTGIFISGILQQGNLWQIEDCRFEEIAFHAFKSTAGRGTMIDRCKFINCGNGTALASNPVTSFVYFGESLGNVVLGSSSNRHRAAAITSSESTLAVSEVYNSSKTVFVDMNYIEITLTDSLRPLCVLSANNSYTYIDYSLRIGEYARVGTITISMDTVRRSDSTQTPVSFTDSYNYSDPSVDNLGGIIMTNFEFGVELQDNVSPTGNETMLLTYINPIRPEDSLNPESAPNATGHISYSISYGV